MSKTRLTSLDISCLVRDLRNKLVGSRVGNIYDLGTKTYLIKFSGTNEKRYMVLENGIRVHTTKFSREHNQTPSTFVLKLRKALRTKRLEAITQVGFDRVVDFQFSTGEYENHLICEFYAGGNIVLTGAGYKILSLLRSYKTEDLTVNISINEIYPTDPQQTLKLLDEHEVLRLLDLPSNSKKNIREFFSNIFVIGKEMIEHCLLSIEEPLDPKMKVGNFPKGAISRVLESFERAYEFTLNVVRDSNPAYLIFSDSSGGTDATKRILTINTRGDAPIKKHFCEDRICEDEIVEGSTPGVKLEDYCRNEGVFPRGYAPLPYAQYDPKYLVKTEDFDTAVDIYYYYVESERIKAQNSEVEKSTLERLDKVKQDNELRINALQNQEIKNEKISNAILENLQAVDEVISIVNGYIRDKLQWNLIEEKIETQKKNGDPLFSIVHGLDIGKKTVTLRLKCAEYEDNDLVVNNHHGHQECIDDEDSSVLVKIDLNLNAHGNCNKYFDMKKKTKSKRQKTLDSSNIAMKNAKTKIQIDQKEMKIKSNIRQFRKIYWFEKFNWFISSDGYMVISGRDMQQNELIYRRYLTAGDIYVHADIHGAASCVIKNMLGGEVPLKTLLEAGTMSVCYSSCWKNKVTTSSWWVYDNQVSKTAPTGEYLVTGSFMIRGKKNYLPPSMLVMGFGVIFKVSDENMIVVDTGVAVDELQSDLGDEDKLPPHESEEDPEDLSDLSNAIGTLEIEGDRGEKSEDTENSHSVASNLIVTNGNESLPSSDKDQSQIKQKKRISAYERKQIKKFGPDKNLWNVDGNGTIGHTVTNKSEVSNISTNSSLEESKNFPSKISKKLEQERQALEKLKSRMEYIKKKQLDQLNQNKKEEEIRNLIKEEKLEMVTREDLEKLKFLTSKSLGVNLKTFSGNPNGEHVLLYAMCVCAPYDALSNYKYKLKLLPGNMRKGKSTKVAIQLFLSDPKAPEREKKLINSIPETELILAMMSDVQLQASGLNNVISNKKKKKL